MPKSRNRYARAQARARYRKPKRRNSSAGWNIGISAIVVAGVVALIVTVAANRQEASAHPRAGNPTTGETGDHWHASLDVNVCGTWEPPTPAFDTEASNPNVRVGIHSHADGLLHIHPFNSSEAGKHATVGRFLDYGGWKASSDSLSLWPDANGKDIKLKNGDTCTMPDGSKKKGVVRWFVNGKERTGSVSDYQPKDHDRIVITFGPKATKLADLGTPPNQAILANPSDQNQNPFSPATSGTGPASSAPPSSSAPASS
jgi:hypothetical protein